LRCDYTRGGYQDPFEAFQIVEGTTSPHLASDGGSADQDSAFMIDMTRDMGAVHGPSPNAQSLDINTTSSASLTNLPITAGNFETAIIQDCSLASLDAPL